MSLLLLLRGAPVVLGGFPDITVQAAWDTDPFDTSPVWTDLDLWESISISRGRQRELDRMRAGRATIKLVDQTRSLDPVTNSDIRPGKRVHINATYSGVDYPLFDGFVDSIDHDYDGAPQGKALVTIRATDGFKFLQAAELPSSVYALEIEADGPLLWWRLDEADGATTVFNSGSLGAAGDGTVIGVPDFGQSSLIDREPGTAMATLDDGTNNGAWVDLDKAGVTLTGAQSFAIEFWLTRSTSVGTEVFAEIHKPGGAIGRVTMNTSVDSKLYWIMVNDAFTVQYGVRSNITLTTGVRYHVVAVHTSGRVMKLYIDGVDVTEADPGSTSGTTAGTITFRDVRLGHAISNITNVSPASVFDEFALWVATGSDPLSAGQIAEHNGYGRTPWTGDSPSTRIQRLLDYAGWPAGWTFLDTGTGTLQGADLSGTTVLEQIQKVADSVFGEVWITNLPQFTFRSREVMWEYQGSLASFGDDPTDVTELAYRYIDPEFSDELIRNDVAVSRRDGKLQRVEDDASIDAYRRHSWSREGLLGESDALSLSMAQFVLNAYKDPKRRISGLTLAPRGSAAAGGTEALLMPQALGRELIDGVEVIDRPPGGGSPNVTTCTIEGITQNIVPLDIQTVWALAPAIPTGGVWIWDEATWDTSVWGF